MNLKEDMMIERLFDMINDLSKHNRDKNELQLMYVEERLNKSLQSYYESLNESLSFLYHRNEKNVLKKMNRSRKYHGL